MDTPGGEITAIFGGKRGRDVVRAGGRSNRGVDVSTTGRLAGGLPQMKAIDPSRPGAALVRARHCEGVHCCDAEGEVRVYPLLFAAHVILCHRCWEQENRYHRERGRDLRCPKHWPQHDWDTAQRYQPTRPSDGTTPTGVISLELALPSSRAARRVGSYQGSFQLTDVGPAAIR